MVTSFFALNNRYGNVALSLSVLLHLLVISDQFNIRSPGVLLANRHKGTALTQDYMRVYAVTPVAMPRAADFIDRERDARHTMPDKKADQAASLSSLPHVAFSPTVEMPAGSQFVLPFTPPVSNLSGRGNWGRAVPPQVEQQEQSFRLEQARAQFRAMLMDRLNVWVARQTGQYREVSCQIRLGMDTRQARLSCTPIEAEAELWSALAGLASTGSADSEDVACLRAGTAQLVMVACDGMPGS